MAADDSPKRTHVLYTRYEKTCRECGGAFISKRIDAQFCDGTCHRRFYDRENRERIRETKRRYRETHKAERQETLRKYYEQHGERVNAEKRQRYALDAADPEKAAAKRDAARQYYLKNRDRILEQAKGKWELERSYRKLSAHGTDYDQLLAALREAQDGKCYLCGDPLQRDDPREVHLDHSHACCPLGKSCERCRRGLACRGCNYLIGIAKDDPGRLRRIADGLERANEAVRERMKQPRPVQPRTRWEMACSYCDGPFVAYRQDVLYCSMQCANRASLERRGLKVPAAPARTAGTVACKECGEMFAQGHPNALYCSKQCNGRAERKRAKARRAS